jgi:hypothetical protein
MREATSSGVPTMQYTDYTAIVCDVQEVGGDIVVEYPTGVEAYSSIVGTALAPPNRGTASSAPDIMVCDV